MPDLYVNKPLRIYMADAASGRPTPGGGSVSALGAALGTSMACMAANFTVGKKKFAAVEDQCRRALDRCNNAQAELLALMDEDANAYMHVSDAYAMPRGTDEEKAGRAEAIQKALRIAMDVPLRVFRICARVCDLLSELADIANPNLISDVGVAAALVQAGLEGAKLNIEVNLACMKDEAFVAQTRERIDEAAARSAEAAAETLKKVRKAIGATV